MADAVVNSKGQITIPKEVRTKLDLKPGDVVRFHENASGEVVFRPNTGSIMDLQDA
jgi:AbrB family looped-hinge helix DNA binding protein